MKALGRFFKDMNRNKALLLMVLPATVWFLFFRICRCLARLLPLRNTGIHGGFLASIIHSQWVGFDNFKFLFSTDDAYIITRNTLLYNIVFIFIGLVLAVAMAIILSEIANKRLAKWYQTGMFMPYFLSWVIVGYFVFSFLSFDRGIVNQDRAGLRAGSACNGIPSPNIGRSSSSSSSCGNRSAITASSIWRPSWASTIRCMKRR